MPLAMSIVWEVAKYNLKSKKLAKLLLKFDTVLGIKIDELEENKEEIPDEVLEQVQYQISLLRSLLFERHHG